MLPRDWNLIRDLEAIHLSTLYKLYTLKRPIHGVIKKSNNDMKYIDVLMIARKSIGRPVLIKNFTGWKMNNELKNPFMAGLFYSI